MRFFLMTMLMVFPGYMGNQAQQPVCGSSKRSTIPVTSINSSALPVRINAATAENSDTNARLDYSITNTSDQLIKSVDLRIFSLDKNANLIDKKESGSPDQIRPGETKCDFARVEEPVRVKGQLLLAVTKVVTNAGVWQVDSPALEREVQNRFRQRDANIGAVFEPNLVVTEIDRGQIFKLIMNDILADEKKAEKLQGQSDLIVLRQSVDFPVPIISDKRLFVLSQEQIQEIAEREKRVFFLRYEPLRIEGSRVLATIAIRDTVTRLRGAFVQNKYNFAFTCAKQNDKWIIEESIGFAKG